MTISVQCDNCQRNYNVSESHAGKKFRCKGCQSVVSVPAAASAPADDDPFGFDMSAMSAGGGGGDDWESGMPAPVKKSPSKKGKKKSTSKSRSRSSGSGAGTGKVIGGVAGGLVTLLVLASVGLRVAQRMNGAGLNLGFGPSWSSYTTPGGEATFDVPGAIQTQPGGPMAAPGSTMYLGESRDFACGVLVEPKPIELQGFSEDEALSLMEPGVPTLGGNNVRRTTVNGRAAMAYDVSRGGFSGHCAVVIGTNYVYSLLFLYKDNYDAAAETRFLESVRLNQ